MARPVIGDHKGYGLALVLEILTGVLTGAGFGQMHAPEPLAPDGSPQPRASLCRAQSGHLHAAGAFTTHMEQLRQDIIHDPRLPGVERILLPGN